MTLIANVLRSILDSFFAYTGNYGVAVILLSAFIMIITFPLNRKQIQFQKAMQLLKPETEAIKKQFKGDKDKINQATMELWKKYDVNPAMGCLPMLIQLPVLFAMFSVLQTEGLFAANTMFLGLDLTLPNAENTIRMLGVRYWVLPLLAVVTTFWQSYQITPADDQSQKTMLYIMPLFMGYITVRFPTALALYWVSRNVFTIAQQYWMSSFAAAPQMKAGEAKDNDNSGKNRKDS